MGEAKRWRDRFFEEHPRCCFCGGGAPATTVDHQPGRVFFRNREWPEGFAFPACEPCNSLSKTSERVLAVLVHGHAGAEDETNRAAYRANLESVRREFPDEVRDLIPSSRDIRNTFKRKKLVPPEGVPFADIPMVRFGGPFWDRHLEMFSRKLLLALHYQCFHRILPPSGGMWIFLHTNVNLVAGDFPKEVIDLTHNIALPRRGRRNLHDQLVVRWTYTEETPTAVFVVVLQRMLVVTGITTEVPELFDELSGLIRPFEPSVARS
jgi:hypothetical protein